MPGTVVLVIYCCITFSPRIWLFEKYVFTISPHSVGQESGHSLARYVWFKFSHVFTVKLLASPAVSSEGLTGAGCFFAKTVPLMAGGWRP